MFISFFMFLSGILGIIMIRKHYLMSLLMIELFFISIYLGLYFFLLCYSNNFFFLVSFLVLSVCEGVLGLSLIVYLVRKGTLEYVNSLVLC